MRCRAFVFALITLAACAQPAPTRVKFSTSAGDFTVELNAKAAPLTVKNFLHYVNKGQYANTVFHRVVPGFVVQGGGFSADGKEKPTDPPIKNEANNGLKNLRGTLAMARTSAPDSATAQFYVNLKDNGNLDFPSFDNAGYCVFGKVVGNGMQTIDRIAADAGKAANPATAVVVRSAEVVK